MSGPGAGYPAPARCLPLHPHPHGPGQRCSCQMGSSSSYPCALGEDRGLPTTGHCREEISPSHEAEIQVGGRLKGVASNTNLRQRGFSACPREGRDASTEASACEISKGGLGNPPFDFGIQPLPSERARGNPLVALDACSPQQGMVDRAVAAP